jgi:uroporphyrinogen decarboxylase
MNKVERVRAAVAGEKVDRVPASFWFHFTPDKHHGKASVQAHMDFYRESNVDFLKVMNEHPYRGNVDIASPADWRRLRPAPLSSDFYQEQLDEVKMILDEIQDEALVLVTIFGPFRSGNNTSDAKVTDHLKADPLAVSQGLEAIAESLADFAVALIDAGAAGIYYSAQGGEQDRFTEFEFLQYIKPHDLTVLNAIKDKGEFNLLHICKDYIRLPLYADYPGHVVNWAATKHNLSLREGRTLFKRTICGGMDDRGVMVDGSEEEIQAEVKKVIKDFGTEGFILGADCTLPTDIDVSNIRAAVEATAL